MSAIEQPVPTDDLPLLTKVVDEDVQHDLPTLTEVVEEIHPALPPFEVPAIAGDELPVLMEVIAAEPPPDIVAARQVMEDAPPPAALSEADMQLLLQRLEAHIESVFTKKLSLRLEQLQRQAIEQAVGELKAELPRILRDALDAPHTRR
ncbi:hypothetical protein FGKAn22_17110 [Ferrigenium kumadai]|uniref:Uncharacterized protein n=1 Tax=Ferrigenium kumadai TaxID=1682490 RepID=A0AAN1SZL9_9PROT|nr:hypothetical protein [Ferrigenium kumadai]BBJ00019.1 hypothetical protein FGKAn22_17110 [Ferrigenium kumadai]